jgi:hypothetical protein
VPKPMPATNTKVEGFCSSVWFPRAQSLVSDDDPAVGTGQMKATPELRESGRGFSPEARQGNSNDSFFVIPAKAGIQGSQCQMDSSLRGYDAF